MKVYGDPRNIIIAVSHTETGEKLRRHLIREGFPVRSVTTSGHHALSYMDDLGSGVVICSYKLSDMIYEDLASDLPANWRMILLASPSQLDEGSVFSESVVLLPLPLRAGDLDQTLTMLLDGIRRAKKRSAATPRTRTPEEEKTLDNAKLILMERHHMTEPEAHRYLQKNAMDSGVSIVEAAEMVEALYI